MEDARSMDLARIFLTIFILGSLVVAAPLLFPSFGVNPLLKTLGTVIPIVLMVIFMRIGRHRVEEQGSVEIEQVADSLYFMGFMFTLVALLVALRQISFPVDMSAITSRFGIAMITTLVGLLLKVLLTQFKQVGGVSQRQAQNDLLRATIRFTRALDRSSANVEKTVNDAAAKMLALAEASITDMTDYAKSAQESVAVQGKSALKQMSAQSKSDIEMLAAYSKSNIEGIVGQGKAGIEMMSRHSKEAQIQMLGDSEAASKALAEVSKSSSVANSEYITRLNMHLSGLQGVVEKTSERFDDLSSTVDGSIQKHSLALEPLERFGSFLAGNNDLLSDFQGTLTSVVATGSFLNESVERLEGAVTQLQGSLSNAARVNSYIHLGDDADQS
ncbi:hypothetical protein IMCC3135_13565 [Granulosicoccus antarcticus IMCC3135]|uniref:Uncharacterized protein n=2 Tax=Granulosicoccus TaxID=437504 RepID=A0A2Z2NSS7_9GAMM|nr:hypothetical protein IMCC3135_13565 [Granulosicoccus antarcticus IMCC3135]